MAAYSTPIVYRRSPYLKWINANAVIGMVGGTLIGITTGFNQAYAEFQQGNIGSAMVGTFIGSGVYGFIGGFAGCLGMTVGSLFGPIPHIYGGYLLYSHYKTRNEKRNDE